jgi:hypothetical protein
MSALTHRQDLIQLAEAIQHETDNEKFIDLVFQLLDTFDRQMNIPVERSRGPNPVSSQPS